MATIVPDPVSFTTHHLHLCFTETDSVLSSGTGFIYERNGTSYLITNWHNVAGKNPVTGTCLSETLAIPDIISTLFRQPSQPGECKREAIQLYKDEQLHAPAWYEHPIHSHAVDVVALKIPEHIANSYMLYPINKIDFDQGYKECVADDAFVVGYPFSEVTYLQMPIWKRASIASEPDIDLDSLPKLLIDTATRSGLSGSPVLMARSGIHGILDGVVTASTVIGRIRNFIGVYSGRIGTDELKAQLGVVWKAKVIDEIIDAATFGAPPYEV